MAAEASETPAMGVGRPAEVGQVSHYLMKVVPVLLEEGEDTTDFKTALQSAEARLKRFIEEPQEHALSILRSLPPEEEGEAGSPDTARFRPSYSVLLGVQYRSSRCVGLVFIKRGPMLEADKNIQAQLRLIHISDDSPFETLHAYVQNAVTPLFNSYVQQGRREER